LKWTRPFRRKTNSGFCACAVTFRVGSTFQPFTNMPVSPKLLHPLSTPVGIKCRGETHLWVIYRTKRYVTSLNWLTFCQS